MYSSEYKNVANTRVGDTSDSGFVVGQCFKIIPFFKNYGILCHY